jgi:hypothetical protein
MSEGENRIRHRVVSDDFDRDIAEANDKIDQTNRANRAMISNVRMGLQLGIFTAQALGFMIDQTLTLLIEAVALSIEVGQKIFLATLGGGGFAAFGLTGIAQLASIIAMGILIVQIKQKRTEAAQQTQGIVSVLRMAGFRSG